MTKINYLDETIFYKGYIFSIYKSSDNYYAIRSEKSPKFCFMRTTKKQVIAIAKNAINFYCKTK